MQECNHKWVYSNNVLLSNPPIYKKICKICGKQELEREKIKNDETYDEIIVRFKSGKE